MVAFIRQYQYNFDMVPNRMQLQNMCKKGAQIFQRIRPKMERPGSPSGIHNDGKGDDNNDRRHINSVLLRKMVGYTPSSFTNFSSPAKGSMWV